VSEERALSKTNNIAKGSSALLGRLDQSPLLKRMGRLTVLLDQAAISAANLAFSLILIRVYSPADFGAYSLGLFTALAISGAYRVGVTIPLTLWPERQFEERRTAVSGLHLIVIGLTLIIGVSVAILTAVAYGQTFWTHVAASTTALLALYMSMDVDRTMSMRRFGLVTSCLISITLSASMLTLGLAAIFTRAPLEVIVALLGALALTKTVLLNLGGARVSKSAREVWLLMSRNSLSWGVAGSLFATGYTTLPQWVLGIQAPALQVAGFAAVRTPLQPLMILLRSFDTFDKLIFGRLDRGDHAAIAKHGDRTLRLYVMASMALVVGVFFLADPMIRLLLGETYLPFATTLKLTSASFAMIAIAAPLETRVFSQDRHKYYALHQLAGAALVAVSIVPLVRLFQANGAVVASMIGWIPPYIFLLLTSLSSSKITHAEAT
jgi:O-antigen/teichoic acid export membrane protein